MIYPGDFEQKLGFDQIRQRLRGYCLCALGQRKVDALFFLTDAKRITSLLCENKEMCFLLRQDESILFTNFFDPEELFDLIAVEGSFLEEDTFRQIILSLQTIFAAQQFLEKNQELYPNLFQLTVPVTLSRQVLTHLESKFDEFGKVKDNASPELQRIRKRLREELGKVRRIAEQIFRSAADQGWVPEGMSTSVRDGRMVIPVLSTHKRKIRGHTMDESSTGQTVFIEPAEVLEANNELRDLQLEERREVVRILKELTSSLRAHLDSLQTAYQFLAGLDFNRAKARLAFDLESELPQLQENPLVDWVNARHPLLFLSLRGKRPVVPLTIHLTANDHFLLISGPNAGGKSVCLKTVGLIQYMMQCGLLVPVDEHSRMGLFDRMFIDIGDQQSIENDLSTYSSHLKNMSQFLRQGTEQSLVLMDELGSGTDPNFGGGIAQAILKELVQKKVWGVATTHYYNLKLFAETTAGILNGAMLFNSQKLEPLFILEVGKPGSSFALEIARKIGLPASTILAAEEMIGKDLTGLESLMKTVAEEKISNTKKAADLKKKEIDLKELQSRYDKLVAEVESRKKEIIEKAKNEASTLLKETNREIEKTIRHIRENKAERKETKKVREGLKDLSDKVKVERPSARNPQEDEIRENDKVRIRGQEVSGTVVQLKGKYALVEFGHVRSQIKVDQLVRSDLVEASSALSRIRSVGIDMLQKRSSFSNTLDVRGKRVDELIPLLTQFLDDATLVGHGELKILHGKGEGVLRKVVREQLKKTKAVASFADEHIERGGDGITVVVLK
jgi:DNA mismatch repair protein MutS2